MADRRDGLGTLVGLLVFLGGVALLLVTFQLAYVQFGAPPERTLGLTAGQPLDLPEAGRGLLGFLVRFLLLLAMGAVGSMVATRGLKLYAAARPTALPAPRPTPNPTPAPGPSPASDADSARP